MGKQSVFGRNLKLALVSLFAAGTLAVTVLPASARCNIICRQQQDASACKASLKKQGLKGAKYTSEYEVCLKDPQAYASSH